MERLTSDGHEGAYGFFEAVDYTPARLPPNQDSVTVRSFMAHHQGMSLLSLEYLLLDRPMQRRFISNPFFKSIELLLQERVPKETAVLYPHEREAARTEIEVESTEAPLRTYRNPSTAVPEVHLLSNGRYHLMVTNAGGSSSRWKEMLLTRWREDPTRDCWGMFFYLRDAGTGEFWSTTYQPTLQSGKHYEAIFSSGRAEYRCLHNEIEAHTEISISPEDDVEVRRVTLNNHSRQDRRLEFTTYAEVVLNTATADAAHPAFSNLFVQTQILRESRAILCTRRPRSQHEAIPCLFHLVALQGREVGEASYETDRAQFVGRTRDLVSPAAMRRSLTNSEGAVLDPVVAIRRTIDLPSEGSAVFVVITGVAETPEAARLLIEKYRDHLLANRIFELAWTHSLVVLRHLNASEADGRRYERLASSLLYMNQVRRANASVLLQNRRGQNGLWSYGISGDLPVILLRATDLSRIELVRQLLQAHGFWRMKGLQIDLVILVEDTSVYRQHLFDQIMGMIASGMEASVLDKAGGIFVRKADQVSPEDRVLLQAVARVVLSDTQGTLQEQLDRRGRPDLVPPTLNPSRTRLNEPSATMEVPERQLIFFNGLGGFTPDGREYVTVVHRNRETPAPWVNVLANPGFGTVVSESGGGYTWCENSHEFRLTPWSNDPVSDTTGEAFYIRDEQTGQFWSPTPLPARGRTPYVARHGFGYSVFEHHELGITSELWVYVAVDAPVKFCVLKLRNDSGRRRHLSATGYWEWVLGDLRAKHLAHVVTEIDPRSGALFARNSFNPEFAGRTAFVDINDAGRSVTGDRAEFVGRNQSPAVPAAMGRSRLSGKVGAGLDPCGALQVVFELSEGQEREIVFLLGSSRSTNEGQQFIQRFRGSHAARGALEAVWAYWNRVLGTVYLDTPDRSLNFLANGWLLYQTIACRMWGRTGFYQSGGAFGFRDQLQDAMALVHAEPGLLREHLLRAAARQYREGDVQHWWHPPQGRGVRTHFSDDYLWLPYATCRYVLAVGDTGVLDEPVGFLEGRPVRPEEESYYDLPQRSEEMGTLYEHCVRAIKHGLRFGAHGLPLIGCGDWNDGMNLIGEQGKGESVWLAFFLYDVLTQFAEVARGRQDTAFAERCLSEAARLQQNIEAEAWDGAWYRRAYFDNGEPLGSASNPECQIDSLPQSWSVISGGGDPERSRQALESVYQRLVRLDAGLIQLFDPPFDKSKLEPGYIKGYLPGVRENGGQYTHGAIWTVLAFALRQERARAWELFQLINPIRHGENQGKIMRYKVEPYVVAADVYGVAPHVGRGGWTWYTGSAGWLYRLAVEYLVGVQFKNGRLRIRPALPEGWSDFLVHYRFRDTFYHISISGAFGDPAARAEIRLDGQAHTEETIPLADDRQEHNVEVRFVK